MDDGFNERHLQMSEKEKCARLTLKTFSRLSSDMEINILSEQSPQITSMSRLFILSRVTKYIYSSTVLKNICKVLELDFALFCHFTCLPQHNSEEDIFTFYLAAVVTLQIQLHKHED